MNQKIQEFPGPNMSGWPIVALHLIVSVFLILLTVKTGGIAGLGLGVIAGLFFFIMWGGYMVIEPNMAAVLMFAGEYKGTVQDNGLRWTNPFYSARKVSLRQQNFESSRLKVNDLDGNPIEIGAVVVWRVAHPANALFGVDNYGEFIKLQTEAALRTLANHYAYDSHADGVASLRDNPDEIVKQLSTHIQERLAEAGIEILEARISHLAYAQEIASSMLQRQQASAVVAARATIVAGAVGMVELALAELEKKGTVQLDEERKAQMVSNLLVVLCSDRAAHPVVNVGSIH